MKSAATNSWAYLADVLPTRLVAVSGPADAAALLPAAWRDARATRAAE